jgi:hypothetical protein
MLKKEQKKKERQAGFQIREGICREVKSRYGWVVKQKTRTGCHGRPQGFHWTSLIFPFDGAYLL